MSISALESPLAADPVILMSFLRCVPVMRGSRGTCTSSIIARAFPMVRLACSCLAMVHVGSPEAYLVVSQSVWCSTVPAVHWSPWEQSACVFSPRYLEIGHPEGWRRA
jgi:hypothetical protein